ncbi:uncharacterized protein LOC141686254 [Apium graveolens]|uniref:uncharacterized protein LOC141686254 n=1 Tax=Apium graveolens TaxID=4045 RepID=UPI003D7BE509
MIKLYHSKCVHGIIESAFGELLSLMKDVFPNAHLPLSFNAAKSVIRDLGLDYQKIHACQNSCMLYWAENKDKDVCDTCGVSRCIIQEKKGIPDNNDPPKLIHKVPANVMRLGVAADGFNPFRSMNLSHSTWPIVLVNYNLPPWLCMKQENLILSTLISGPESPKNNIDVYMQPLIAELKSLWNIGVEVYDALTVENFQLRASVLWTINDFLGYVMLSGWSTKGKLACPKTLKPQVALPMIKFGAFLRGLWSKVIDLDDLKRLQTEIVEVLCEFEMIFPQAFFDIMVHLPVHLCGEVEYGGPVHLRCMFPIERYLGKLKSYVRNRSKPEGSIAEGYLAEECVTFCSRFLSVDDGTKNPVTDFGRYPANEEYHIGTKKNKDEKDIQIKRYSLEGSTSLRIVQFQEYRAFVGGLANPRRYKREREHTEEFWKWLKEVVLKRDNISRELEVFALGPNRAARKFNGYEINRFRFHTKFRDSRCTTQNSEVFLTAETTSFASSKDQNPIVGNVNYYGSIEEIFELDYWGAFRVVLFKCCWYQEEKDLYGLTRVNFNKLCQKSDPYVLASQVQQVFYVEDPFEKNFHYVIKNIPRDWCDTENQTATEEDMTHLQDICNGNETIPEFDDGGWIRDDVPLKEIHIPSP